MYLKLDNVSGHEADEDLEGARVDIADVDHAVPVLRQRPLQHGAEDGGAVRQQLRARR